jgi:hypothetical protein
VIRAEDVIWAYTLEDGNVVRVTQAGEMDCTCDRRGKRCEHRDFVWAVAVRPLR